MLSVSFPSGWGSHPGCQSAHMWPLFLSLSFWCIFSGKQKNSGINPWNQPLTKLCCGVSTGLERQTQAGKKETACGKEIHKYHKINQESNASFANVFLGFSLKIRVHRDPGLSYTMKLNRVNFCDLLVLDDSATISCATKTCGFWLLV